MIGNIDVTPINLFGGIPDEDLNGQTTESTLKPLKTPQAMSIPVTEVPRSSKNATVPQDSVPVTFSWNAYKISRRRRNMD